MTESSNRRVHELTFRVRFAETDMMGIVHHANYLVYFEAARVDFSREVGAPYADFEASGYSLAVSQIQIRYIAPARFDQLITVRTWVEELKSRTVIFDFEVVDAQSRAQLATGNAKFICVNHTGQVRRIPATWYNAMQPLAASI